MQQFSFTQFVLSFITLVFLFQSTACKDDDGTNPLATFDQGIFITNEGPFQTGTGTVSFYHRNSGETSHHIFEAANSGEQLGNIVQSMCLHNGKAYVVVNNAAKVVVTDASTFVKKGELTGVSLPRYFLPVSASKGYLSQWGSDGVSGNVAVVNLGTLQIEKTIPTGTAAEQMLRQGDKLYVTNTYGFLGRDSTVAVIDLNEEIVLYKVVVGDNPNAIQQDKNGAIWVVCAGHIEDFLNPSNPLNTPGRLVKMEEDKVKSTYILPGSGSHLVTDSKKERLFYLVDGAVYEFNVTQNKLNPQPFVSGYFYALGFDPQEERLLASDPKDFQSNGEVKLFSTTGNLVGTIPAGIIPGWFSILN